ncbi:MAG: efflux RND transporter permease subunit, partial [Gammaproteobacteria bacterium]|nr:efflux RND transporter permease subunit [Gammaproteobacteria bacterium]
MLWLRCEISHSIFGPEQSISFQERNVTAGEFRGPIAYMAANPVAANLLMGFLLVVGLISAVGLPQEFLPEASLDRIQVVVPYPGAAPSEVEELIVRKIEEQIQSVEGVKRIESSAAEGLGSVIAEFRQGTDMNRALADMTAQVDSILTSPAGAERPRETSGYCP